MKSTTMCMRVVRRHLGRAARRGLTNELDQDKKYLFSAVCLEQKQVNCIYDHLAQDT